MAGSMATYMAAESYILIYRQRGKEREGERERYGEEEEMDGGRETVTVRERETEKSLRFWNLKAHVYKLKDLCL